MHSLYVIIDYQLKSVDGKTYHLMIENVFFDCNDTGDEYHYLIKCHVLTTKDHNTSINIITNDLTCINLLNFYNQNMFKQLENLVYFAFWLWKSLSYNAIDKYITIKSLLHFCLYTISFFKSKSMSILSRSDISSNQC